MIWNTEQTTWRGIFQVGYQKMNSSPEGAMATQSLPAPSTHSLRSKPKPCLAVDIVWRLWIKFNVRTWRMTCQHQRKLLSIHWASVFLTQQIQWLLAREQWFTWAVWCASTVAAINDSSLSDNIGQEVYHGVFAPIKVQLAFSMHVGAERIPAELSDADYPVQIKNEFWLNQVKKETCGWSRGKVPLQSYYC